MKKSTTLGILFSGMFSLAAAIIESSIAGGASSFYELSTFSKFMTIVSMLNLGALIIIFGILPVFYKIKSLFNGKRN